MPTYELTDIENMEAESNIEGLIEALSSQDDLDVRRSAAEALGRVGDARAADALAAAAVDSDEDLRVAAIKAALHVAARKSKPKQSTTIPFHIAFFLLGAFLWAIFIRIFTMPLDSPIVILGIVFFVIDVSLGLKGWGWFAQYGEGTVGEAIKFLAFFLIGCTVVGMIPICYWTGKGAIMWLHDRGWLVG